MPGNVANAVATTVMPWNLCKAFARVQSWPEVHNDYPDGRRQIRTLAGNSRKSWQLTHRLSAADLDELRTFWLARKGPQEAFYFYDVYETDPPCTYDEGGAALDGRYKVRFEGGFASEWTMARFNTELQLIEVA
jgi:hypothetical protein